MATKRKQQIEQVQRQVQEMVIRTISPPRYTLAQLRNLNKAV